MRINAELAGRLAAEVQAEPKMCYRNSAMAMFVMAGWKPQLQVTYVEGWLAILGGRVPIEHGWLLVEGDIVDVTLLDKSEAGHYHPVLRFNADQVLQQVERYGKMPLFGNNHAGLRAMNSAWQNLESAAHLRQELVPRLRAMTETTDKTMAGAFTRALGDRGSQDVEAEQTPGDAHYDAWPG